MKTVSRSSSAENYEQIAQAIAYIRDNAGLQPSLEQIASHVGLSPWHFQRKFRAWVGVSPKRFLEYLTVQHAKELLDKSASVLDAALDLGLSGPGRLHDQFVSIDAVTPGQYKQFGNGLRIYFGIHPSPVGLMFLALTDKGICELAFGSAEILDQEVKNLGRRWPAAQVFHDPQRTAPTADRIFSPRSRTQDRARADFRLFVKGTNFQINVWRALLRIPEGSLISYKQLAHVTGNPSAVRATASAVGANPVSYLIPCHRVLRTSGELGGYHWGIERKRALIAWDSALTESVSKTGAGQ
ncbi:MAG: methylated-DNA--[protein]-cysteine S-methyltransferase [Gammaproteobacteria bacterium]|nr:methylated-DNA--[protein]-cysteine S-methyltransferase [Gammaproteobacteria bacterium]